MKVTRFAKWSVSNGAEGETVELTLDDIGMKQAGDINTTLDQVRILQYLTTYILYQRMVASQVMTQQQFDDEMKKFGFEKALVAAYTKSLTDVTVKPK